MVTQASPYLLEGPAVLSFSGGRTSGMLLWETLQANGGGLPENVRVVFCNTGKEREETLEFVERCSQRWNVPITWLEYFASKSGKFRKKDGKALWHHTFRVVDFATASRKGEPFELAIATRTFLPNPVMRFCTGELKIKTTNRFVRHALGWKEYTNAIGFRADEPNRVANIMGKHKADKKAMERLLPMFGDDYEAVLEEMSDEEEWKAPVPGETAVCPLFQAGVTVDDVMAFWARQPFDLELQPHEGNCDLCFLKGVRKLDMVLAKRPELADWWIEQEQKIAKAGTATRGTFRSDRPSYLQLKMAASGAVMPGHLDFGQADPTPDGRGCSVWDDCRCTD